MADDKPTMQGFCGDCDSDTFHMVQYPSGVMEARCSECGLAFARGPARLPAASNKEPPYKFREKHDG